VVVSGRRTVGAAGRLAEAVARVQQPASGHWYQVLKRRDITATSGSIGIKHLCVRFRLLISEPIVADDYKGVGPFIMAALELGR